GVVDVPDPPPTLPLMSRSGPRSTSAAGGGASPVRTLCSCMSSLHPVSALGHHPRGGGLVAVSCASRGTAPALRPPPRGRRNPPARVVPPASVRSRFGCRDNAAIRQRAPAWRDHAAAARRELP